MADAHHNENFFSEALRVGIANQEAQLHLNLLTIQGAGEAIAADAQGIWHAATHPISTVKNAASDYVFHQMAVQQRLLPNMQILADPLHHNVREMASAANQFSEALLPAGPTLMMSRMGLSTARQDFHRIHQAADAQAVILNPDAPGITPALVHRAEDVYKSNAGPVVVDAALALSVARVGLIARGGKIAAAVGDATSAEQVTADAIREANAADLSARPDVNSLPADSPYSRAWRKYVKSRVDMHDHAMEVSSNEDPYPFNHINQVNRINQVLAKAADSGQKLTPEFIASVESDLGVSRVTPASSFRVGTRTFQFPAEQVNSPFGRLTTTIIGSARQDVSRAVWQAAHAEDAASFPDYQKLRDAWLPYVTGNEPY